MRRTLVVVVLLLLLVSAVSSQTKPDATAQAKPGSTDQVVPAASPSKPRPWLLGVWEGTGYQADDDSTWALKLIATRQKGGRRVYTIDYPSLNCSGRWKLLSMSPGLARFREEITRGQDKCSQNGLVVVERKGRGQIIFLYSNDGSREITASAILNRKQRTQGNP